MIINTMRVGKREVEVIEWNFNMLETIIKCPNCGQEVKYGDTRMNSGFVGCDNYLGDSNRECYFDDLLPRLLKIQKDNYDSYIAGEGIYLRELNEGK